MPLRVPFFVRWLPRVLYAIGVLSLLGTLFGSVTWLGDLLDFLGTWVVPVPLFDWVSAVVAIMMGAALERRKRSAWRIAVGVLAFILLLYALTVTVLIALGDVQDEMPTLVGQLATNSAVLVAALVGMFVHRRFYTAQTQPGNLTRALIVLALGITVSSAIALVIQLALRGFTTKAALGLLWDLLGVNEETVTPGWLLGVLGLSWALSFLAAMWTLLRSQQDASRMTIADETRVRELLNTNPGDSLGYFATRRDKSVVLTENAGVAYRVEAGVCLAAGDPLGERRYWPAAAKAFVDYATEYGWTPAVIGASEAGARAYQDAGLRALHIGDEAVLHPARFQLNQLAEVRRAVRRLTDLGYTTRVRRHASIPGEELAHLAKLAEDWLGGEEERGFSMALGRIGDPTDGNCLLVEALFPGDGGVAGLLSFAPWGQDGVSLDVMRRHRDADHGITELMVNALMQQGPDQGIARASLNFAVFRAAFVEGAQIGAGPLKRIWRKLLLFASRWWQLESLYRSNAKYDPEWLPRMISYQDGGDLTRVALAMGIAEGFVTPPRWLGGGEDPQPIFTAEQAQPILALQRTAPKPVVKLPEQVAGRFATRKRMLAEGLQPYPVTFKVSTSCQAATGRASVAGRVLGVRDHGGVIFVTLRDWSGDLQLMLERNQLGAESLARFRSLVHLGDQVGAAGIVTTSRTGTRSLAVGDWTMTAKALRPLPDKFHGMKDPEARVRQRYLDIIINPEQRHLLKARSTAINAMRDGLRSRGYLEVETPILQPVHGGANARPFTTHINAYNLGLYLRIAPELYLKRLMVGGVDRVFEIGRNFRNEGADATHNPEFTMLEAYQAYADYNVMRELTRELILEAARAALGTTVVRGVVNDVMHEIDLAEPWAVVSITDAVSAGVGEHVTADTPLETLRGYADRLGINYDPKWTWGAMLQELYEHLAEGTTVRPTFFSDFPAETSPLTRPHRQDDRLAERWDLIIFGAEVGTAYSELVDPVLQRERLTAQSMAAAGGDAEAMELDEDFLQALEHGMPPSGGLGMGLDRLVMMLTNSSIRQTIAFPLVRPRLR